MNGSDVIVKLLSATRCYAKAIIDVAAVKFRFSVLLPSADIAASRSFGTTPQALSSCLQTSL